MPIIYSYRLLLVIETAILVVLLSLPALVQAETKTIVSEATYIMGDGETPSFAESMAIQKAKQTALEEAGTYVQSYTKVLNQQLTADEIQTIAGGVLQVEVLDKKRELISDGLRVSVKIRAMVTTDKVEELAGRIKGTQAAEEYKKLKNEYAQLTVTIEALKKSLANSPSGQARDSVLDQIREEQKQLRATQIKESSLFQRVVSGGALIRQAEDRTEEVDSLIKNLFTEGFTVEIGEINAAPHLRSSELTVLDIPIKITRAASFARVLTALGEKLEGFAYPETRISFGGRIVPGGLLIIPKSSSLRGYTFTKVTLYSLVLRLIFFSEQTSSSTLACRYWSEGIYSGRGSIYADRPAYLDTSVVLPYSDTVAFTFPNDRERVEHLTLGKAKLANLQKVTAYLDEENSKIPYCGGTIIK